MPFSAEFEKYIWEGIIFLAYLFICGGLMERRFSKKISLLAGALTLAVIVMIQAALLGSGEDATLVLTLLPVTAYLPVVICLHILSKSSFFQTVAVWTVATAAYFLLNIFHKVLQQGLANGVSGPATEVWMLVGLLLLASLLVFISLRFLRRPFQRYVLQNSSGWTLLCLLVLLVYFLFSYFSNSTTDMTALLLLLVTGFLVFLLLVCLIVAAASIRQLQVSTPI